MTNYEYLMGTPALAAQTISKIVNRCQEDDEAGCDACPLLHADCMDYRGMKEFLESEMG